MEEIRDANGTLFDPELHGQWHGKPKFKKDGTFRTRPGRKSGKLALKEAKEKVGEEKAVQQTIHDQLFKAAKQYKFKEEGIDALRAIADNVIDWAVNPDGQIDHKDQKWAIEQVWDRLYGKASQKTETEKKITVEVIREFDLPDPKRAYIEGEVVKETDEDLEEVMREIQ